jgi:hypothetical protein
MRPRQTGPKVSPWRPRRNTSKSRAQRAKRVVESPDISLVLTCDARLRSGRAIRWQSMGGRECRCRVAVRCVRILQTSSVHFHGSMARWESARLRQRTGVSWRPTNFCACVRLLEWATTFVTAYDFVLLTLLIHPSSLAYVCSFFQASAYL